MAMAYPIESSSEHLAYNEIGAGEDAPLFYIEPENLSTILAGIEPKAQTQDVVLLPPAANVAAPAATGIFFGSYNRFSSKALAAIMQGYPIPSAAPLTLCWIPGMVASAGLGALVGLNGLNRFGNSTLDNAGAVFATGAGASVGLAAVLAPLAYHGKLPYIGGVNNLAKIGWVTKTAKFFGGAAGIAFTVSDVVSTMKDDGASDTELGLGIASAGVSSAAILIGLAPVSAINGVPVAGTFVFLVLIGGSIALAHAGAKAKEDRLLAEKILRHLKSNPPISGARSIQLNRVIHDNIGSRPVHMLLEKIIKDKDVKILRNIPPFIKRTMQSKLYKDLWFVNDRTEMLDALLEIYGASEGEKKNVEFQLIRRLKALSRSAAVDLLDIIKTQDRPMMAQLLRMPLE